MHSWLSFNPQYGQKKLATNARMNSPMLWEVPQLQSSFGNSAAKFLTQLCPLRVTLSEHCGIRRIVLEIYCNSFTLSLVLCGDIFFHNTEEKLATNARMKKI